MSPEEKCSIDLLRILRGYDLGLYDKIMKWRYACEQEYGHHIDSTSPPAKSARNFCEAYPERYMGITT